MTTALVYSERSLCSRAQVGAVACDSERRVVAVGWNSPPAGVETGGRTCEAWCPRGAGISHRPGYSDCTTVHAELNALLYADRGELRGGTVYVTRVPCAACAKAIAAAGVARIVVMEDEGGVYHRPEEVFELMRLAGVEVEVYGG